MVGDCTGVVNWREKEYLRGPSNQRHRVHTKHAHGRAERTIKDKRPDLREDDIRAACTRELTTYDTEYSPRFEFVGRPDRPTDKARVHGENEKRLLRVLNRERIQILEERKARSDISSAAS